MRHELYELRAALATRSGTAGFSADIRRNPTIEIKNMKRGSGYLRTITNLRFRISKKANDFEKIKPD